MKCPHCGQDINIGALIGSVSTPAKTRAARENAKLGGWPKGKPRKPKRVRVLTPSSPTGGKRAMERKGNMAVENKVSSGARTAGSRGAHGSASRPNDKAYWWLCVCGEWNAAPALQTPNNQVQCLACNKIFNWREITTTK